MNMTEDTSSWQSAASADEECQPAQTVSPARRGRTGGLFCAEVVTKLSQT